jgi:hypothetical protein
MTARSPRPKAPANSSRMAVDLPVPVVPVSLKCLVSSLGSRGRPARVRRLLVKERAALMARVRAGSEHECGCHADRVPLAANSVLSRKFTPLVNDGRQVRASN